MPALADNICRALANKKPGLLDDARQLLNALEYKSDRTMDETFAPDEFLREFKSSHDGANERELRKCAKNIGIVFQVGDEEIRQTSSLLTTDFQRDNERSFIFVAADLKAEKTEREYPRGRLARMTRAVNRCFASPAVVLFRHSNAEKNDFVSLSFVHRRESKTDSAKDVLGRVSILRSIRRENPHRGHLDILKDITLSERLKWMTAANKPANFDGLLAAWLAALDTETLNKRFYAKLLAWFDNAVKQCKFPDGKTEGKSEEQVMRMITRLLFIWFVKEKGLAPETLFTEQFAGDTLKNHQRDNSDYYRAVLQNLFFGTLNTPQKERGFRKRDAHGKPDPRQYREFNLYRYADLLKNPDDFVRQVDPVPFVNGGLFDCLDEFETGGNRQDRRRIDCFTDNTTHRKLLNVPARLFFDQSIGLFPLFNQFKFTVAENTPLDQEVALDPELLGMVFENLLAAITPESSKNARRETGSFYTPRAIVDYMVDEALLAHLTGRLGKESEPRLRQLLSWEDAPEKAIAESEKAKIIAAIDELRILDPAVGSGAFPMGMLHKLVHILSRVDDKNKKWKEKQLVKAAEISDPSVRGRTMDDIERVFSAENNYDDYGRKLFLIQNAIHGADLQTVAVQIARLRFFISLIIDQNPPDDRENRGIEPLPNLETKFVAADSLIGLSQDGQRSLFETGEVQELQNAIHCVHRDYFSAKTRAEKHRLRAKDKKLRGKLAKELAELGFAEGDADRYAKWDLYDQTAGADWFDAEFMLGVRDGFDIVIGNPPYIQLQANGGALGDKYQDAGYETFARTGDIYQLFYEMGFSMMRDKDVLCYITSNSWLKAKYGRGTRKLLAEQVQVVSLLEMGKGVFKNATVDTSVLVMRRGSADVSGKAMDMDRLADKSFPPADEHWMPLRTEGEGPWLLLSPTEWSVLDKMRVAGKPLKEWDISINYGIKTGYNDAFIINNATRNRLIAEHPRSEEIIKPILRGRDIKRYRAEWAEKWLIATLPSLELDIDDYQAVKRHLLSFGKHRLEQTGAPGSRKATGHKWYETQDSIAYHAEFMRDKLIWMDMSPEGRFAYSNEEMYCNDKGFMMTGTSLKYLCAVLNSRLITFLVRNLAATTGAGLAQWKKFTVEAIPVPAIPVTKQAPFIQWTDVICGTRDAEPTADTHHQESEVNRLVYRLYGLTESEIQVVEKGA